MAKQEKTNPVVKKPRKKRHVLRRIVTWLIVLALLAGGALYAWTSLKAEYTVTYTGYTATTGSISNALSFSGSLALIDSKDYTAAADASVRTVYVKPGDDVREGDKLLRLSGGETVKADFDGRVNIVNVEEGDDVLGGDVLVQVADFVHMKVSFRVDEYDIADVAVGMTCTVTATATEQEFTSTVAEINYISSSTGSVAYYTATAYVDVAAGVYPGMQVTVTIPQEEAKDVVVLKMDALSFDENNSAFVYMYDENSELVKVPVEVGVSNGNYVEIKSGLKAGDEVYVEVEVEQKSGLAQIMSSMFGSQRMTPGSGFGGRDFSNMPGGRDFSNMPGGGGNWNNGGGNGGGTRNNGGGSR